ncbi:MAG: hypothetical protein HKM93_03325 [Desulfobacteraceae bacterium]|nr:hypothetical protein [Desulfobacteraceae bacterium]
MDIFENQSFITEFLAATPPPFAVCFRTLAGRLIRVISGEHQTLADHGFNDLYELFSNERIRGFIQYEPAK